MQRKLRVSSASSLTTNEKILRNQSDIFSNTEQTTFSSIFSVNGSPSRKLYRKKELPPNNVFPSLEKFDKSPPSEGVLSKAKLQENDNSYTDLQRPTSALRNPLTGTGLSSNDEYKCKVSKRKGKYGKQAKFSLNFIHNLLLDWEGDTK